MTLYKIKKGWHYSVNKLSLFALPIKINLLWKPIIFFHNVTFMFGGGCDQVADQINKLYGFTLGWFVHKNSVRVGWKWDEDFQNISLYAYYYLNGERKWVYLCSVKQYVEYHASISGCRHCKEIQVLIYGGKDERYLIGGTTIVFRNLKQIPSVKWKLYPYFGGKVKAKEDVRIYLKEE